MSTIEINVVLLFICFINFNYALCISITISNGLLHFSLYTIVDALLFFSILFFFFFSPLLSHKSWNTSNSNSSCHVVILSRINSCLKFFPMYWGKREANLTISIFFLNNLKITNMTDMIDCTISNFGYRIKKWRFFKPINK